MNEYIFLFSCYKTELFFTIIELKDPKLVLLGLIQNLLLEFLSKNLCLFNVIVSIKEFTMFRMNFLLVEEFDGRVEGGRALILHSNKTMK